MKSGWSSRRRKAAVDGSEREGHLRSVARMRRPKIARKEQPPPDVEAQIRRAEAHVAAMKERWTPHG